MYDNRSLLSVRHVVRCAVWVRCVRGIWVRWWCVVRPWWWCTPSGYVIFSHKGTFIDRGGYGIFKGCRFLVSVKSVHLPHTLPKIIFSSSLLTVQSRPRYFLDNDRRSFPENKRTHKYAISQNTITTDLDVLFRTYFIYK